MATSVGTLRARKQIQDASDLTDADLADLLDYAAQGIERAHAPYSRYRVGAAALATNGEVFLGVNVENAVYNLGICAERVAVFDAVKSGAQSIVAVAVVTDGPMPSAPCGACLQVIWEFGPDALIITRRGQSVHKAPLRSLLKCPFDRRYLPQI